MDDNIEKCRVLTIAMNSLRFNFKLDYPEVQSLEISLQNMISEIENAMQPKT